MAGGEFAHDPGFDLDAFQVFLQLDLVTGFQFDMRIDSVGFEEVLCFFGDHGIEGQRCRPDIRQPASFGFMVPFVAIIVAFEQHFFAAHDVFADDVHDGDLFLIALFDQRIDILFERLERFGQDGFSAIMALAQFALEPTARNSNLLPVKANGEVRLRSVLSSSNSGMLR